MKQYASSCNRHTGNKYQAPRSFKDYSVKIPPSLERWWILEPSLRCIPSLIERSNCEKSLTVAVISSGQCRIKVDSSDYLSNFPTMRSWSVMYKTMTVSFPAADKEWSWSVLDRCCAFPFLPGKKDSTGAGGRNWLFLRPAFCYRLLIQSEMQIARDGCAYKTW